LDSPAGALVAAGDLPRGAGEAVLEAGRAAYLSGMRTTEVVAGAIMLVMALLTLRLLGGSEPQQTDLTLPRREAPELTP
ncbi:MAG TPA: hypothetical protein VGK60_00590, partial [Pedococcus sp.]